MRTWEFTFSIDPLAETPLFLQIARGVVLAIEEGRLRPGDPLPATRPLSERLAVNRSTVVSAYEELVAEGWVTGRPGGGTFVAENLQGLCPPRPRVSEAPMEFLPGFGRAPLQLPHPSSLPLPREVLACHTGLPDHRLAPTASLARAYRRAMRSQASAALKFGDPQGHPKLRSHLCEMLGTHRGLPGSMDHMLVTQGGQMAMYLLAQALFAPGDGVAVEALGHRSPWEAFRHAGAELLPIPLDAEGLRVEVLEELLSRRSIRALYLTPQRQYPTTVSLSPDRRMRILELAVRHRFAIIEDDYDGEFQFEGLPILPLASQDRMGVVVFVGTLSKVFSPGLRLGYVWAPPTLIQRLVALRGAVDQRGDQVLELAVAELLEDGELQRHVLRMRALYRERRDFLAAELRGTFGETLAFEVPPGGLAFWLQVKEETDPEQWEAAALQEAVTIRAGRAFTLDDRPIPFARLGFAAYGEAELAQVVQRLHAGHLRCVGAAH